MRFRPTAERMFEPAEKPENTRLPWPGYSPFTSRNRIRMHPTATLTTSVRERSKRGRIQLRRFKLALRGSVYRLPSSSVIYFPLGSSLTESLLRPRARRRAIACLPPRVAIRKRNPCLFERLRRLGWNVLFIRVFYSCRRGKFSRTASLPEAAQSRHLNPHKGKEEKYTEKSAKRTDTRPTRNLRRSRGYDTFTTAQVVDCRV